MDLAGYTAKCTELEALVRHRPLAEPTSSSLRDIPFSSQVPSPDKAKTSAQAYTAALVLFKSGLMQVRTEEGAAHEEYVSVWGRVGRLLRVLAFQADEDNVKVLGGKVEYERVEEANRELVGAFTLCQRLSLPPSSIRACARPALIACGHLLRLCFRSDETERCRDYVIAATKMDLSVCTKASRVTFSYYAGRAENHFKYAYAHSLASSRENIRRIFTYFSVCLTLRGSRVSPRLLNQYRLSSVYKPIFTAIHQGNVREFRRALNRNVEWLSSRRIYLVLQRMGESICFRNLLYRLVERGIYTPRNPKRKGLPLPLFTAALRKSTGERIEGDGMAENVLLGLIAQGYVRGRVHMGHRWLILSKVCAFPSLRSARTPIQR